MARLLNVKAVFTEEVLGTSASNPDVYGAYIAPNAESDEVKDLVKDDKMKEEVAAIEKAAELLEEDEEVKELVPTVFPRDESGNPFFWDYQWKGFFKDAIGGLKKVTGSACSKCTAHKKGVDKNVFVFKRRIPITVNGEITYCTRPLRASTAQGERIALASSEAIPAGSSCEFWLLIMDQKMEDPCLEALEFGFLSGTGQWRNSGKGRFNIEIISDEKISFTEAMIKAKTLI